MSNQDSLFVEISDEQQEVVAGGVASLNFTNLFNSVLNTTNTISKTVGPVASTSGPGGSTLVSGGVSEQFSATLNQLTQTGVTFNAISG